MQVSYSYSKKKEKHNYEKPLNTVIKRYYLFSHLARFGALTNITT